jgi:putative ABC transport system substrate-binding protein
VISRRRFLAAVGTLGLAAPLAAEAQQAGRVYRLGMLYPRAPDPQSTPSTLHGVPLGLRALGYVEGKNLVIERRFADDKLDRLPGLARELVRLRMDVLLAAGNTAIAAARDATRTVPIVMGFIGDPVAEGFVSSLARPGTNVTGVALGEGAQTGKRLELIKETVPQAARIAILATGEGTRWRDRQVDEAQQVAGSLGVKLVIIEIGGGDYDRAFGRMMGERVGALEVAGPIHFRHQARIRELAAKHRLPTIYEWRSPVEAGGLMSYGPNFSALYLRLAAHIDRLFKGANPAELPVERPTKFELVINLKTAKALGLTIPPSLLLRADQVLE